VPGRNSFVVYALETGQAPSTVIGWYRANAPSHGFYYSIDDSNIPPIPGMSPDDIQSIILYRPDGAGQCEGS